MRSNLFAGIALISALAFPHVSLAQIADILVKYRKVYAMKKA